MTIPTVADLIKKLQEFDPKMGVIYQLYSDMWSLPIDQIEVVKAVPPRPGDGRDSLILVNNYQFDSLTDEDKDRLTEYVYFPGN